MAIVDGTSDVERAPGDAGGGTTPDTGLWHDSEAAAEPRTRGGRGRHRGRATVDALFEAPHNGADLWKSRIELAVSAALSEDAARRDGGLARRNQLGAIFDAHVRRCRQELRPVLEASAAILGRWGIEARVHDSMREHPARVPRSFDLCLTIERSGSRGPGRLTLTATESCDFVRVRISVGPSPAGEVDAHVGTTVPGGLSGALVGGLVATLVERVFEP